MADLVSGRLRVPTICVTLWPGAAAEVPPIMRTRIALSRRARRPAGGWRFFAIGNVYWKRRRYNGLVGLSLRPGGPGRLNLRRNRLGIAATLAHIIGRRERTGVDAAASDSRSQRLAAPNKW
jgi:hypothetical protein